MAATDHRLPFRVRVLCSWWHGHGWLSPPTADHMLHDAHVFVLAPAVPVADTVLTHGELISIEHAMVVGLPQGRRRLRYTLGYAVELAHLSEAHLAIGIPV